MEERADPMRAGCYTVAMAWPKKRTRNFVVDGEAFLWHYSGCICCGRDPCTVGKQDSRFFLFIDSTTLIASEPRTLAAAIRWARREGWSAESGPARAMAWNERTNAFEWLPNGARVLDRTTPSPSAHSELVP